MPKKTHPYIVLIGTESLQGKEIKTLLSRKRFPAAKITFCDPDVGEEYSKLTQFGDEPKVIQQLDEKCLEDVDLVLLAADGKTNRKYGKLASQKNILAYDLCQSFTGRFKAPVFVAGLNDDSFRSQKDRLIANPHPVTILLSYFLEALEPLSGLKKAVVFVMQPVSAFSERGIEELASQSIDMLSSSALECKVFKSQIAFNLLSQIEDVDQAGFSRTEKQIKRELEQVLNTKELPLTLSMVQAPVFHSYSLMLNIELNPQVELSSLEDRFKKSPHFQFSQPSRTNPVSAVAAAGQDKIFIGQIKQDLTLPGNFWLWLAGDNLTRGSALNAYEVIDKILSF